MIQICEAKRHTAYVQIGTMAIQALHLGVVWALHESNLLTVPLLFGVIIGEFAAASIVVLVQTRRSWSAPPAHEGVRSVLHEFVTYSGPLAVPTLLSALAAYIDTWMLQRFGGREQQAYYGIAFQYANLAVLFGMSVSNVFWKELAAAHVRGDDARLQQIYTNGTRILFVTSGFITGFFVYWSTPTVVLLVGPAYAHAGPVFSLALLNSMFACYGVVVGAAFLATGKTRLWSIFGTSCAVAGMPISVILLWWFRLGAVGLSAKMLILSAVFQLIYDFAICRLNGWRTDNAFRFAVGAYFLIAGGITHGLIGWLLAGASVPHQITVAGLAYGLLVSAGGLFFVYRYGHQSVLFGRDDRVGSAR